MMIAYGPLNYKVPLFYKFTYDLQGRGAGLLLGGKGKKKDSSLPSPAQNGVKRQNLHRSPLH